MIDALSIPAIRSPATDGGNAAAPVKPASAAEAAPKPAPLYANPAIKFDPTVGLVVIEFRNDAGKIQDSIPNPRQLNAYRTHQTALPGQERAPDA